MGLNRRKFTREFTEAAVRRLELGASVTEVSRACEVGEPQRFAQLAARGARVWCQGVYRTRPESRDRRLLGSCRLSYRLDGRLSSPGGRMPEVINWLAVHAPERAALFSQNASG